MPDTLPCPACGKENRLGRTGCISCRAPLETTAPPGKLRQTLGAIVSALFLLIVGGLFVARFFLPSRMELKVQRALEKEAKKAREAAPPKAVEPLPPPPPPADTARPPEPPAPAAAVDDRLPLREELLRTANAHYAEGRYSQALLAYRQAQRIRKLESDAQRRLDSSLTIFTFRDVNDSVKRGAYAERSGAHAAWNKLRFLDASLLSSDEERAEFQRLLERLRKTAGF